MIIYLIFLLFLFSLLMRFFLHFALIFYSEIKNEPFNILHYVTENLTQKQAQQQSLLDQIDHYQTSRS